MSRQKARSDPRVARERSARRVTQSAATLLILKARARHRDCRTISQLTRLLKRGNGINRPFDAVELTLVRRQPAHLCASARA